MTVQVERTFELAASPERVWEFIADPAKRAGAISVVESYEVHDDDGRKATWQIGLPIPVVSGTVAVETEDRERDAPRYVKFVGRSTALQVTGEHTLEPVDDGERTRLRNQFLVDGRLPGIERFFKRNLERELDNLKVAIEDDLGIPVEDRT